MTMFEHKEVDPEAPDESTCDKVLSRLGKQDRTTLLGGVKRLMIPKPKQQLAGIACSQDCCRVGELLP